MHSRVCAKSHATRSIVFHRPVFQSSSPMEMVVVDEAPFVDVLETLECREGGGVRVSGGGLWARSMLCGAYLRRWTRKMDEEDGRWEVGGPWRDG